jgi:hypothetical protein
MNNVENDKNKDELTELKDKKKPSKEQLPYCTTAPSAEQARAEDEDEPCDDARTGDVE